MIVPNALRKQRCGFSMILNGFELAKKKRAIFLNPAPKLRCRDRYDLLDVIRIFIEKMSMAI